MRRQAIRGLLLLVLAVAALAAVLGFRGFGPGSARLSELMADEAQFASLTEGRREDTSLLPTLLCNENPLPTAGADYYYSMVENDPRAFDPIVETKGDTPVSIVFERTTPDAAFVEAGEPLSFAVYTDDSYAFGRLYLTTLPVISITVTEPDNEGSYEVRGKTPRWAELTLFDNREGVPANLRTSEHVATLHVRGDSSALLPKLSYRLSLYTRSLGGHLRKDHRALLGIRKDEDWILSSCSNDIERMRNHLSYNLWHDTCARDNCMNADLGITSKYVEVLMNGKYLGLYNLMHPMDEKQIGLPDDGFYYRALNYDVPTDEELDAPEDESLVSGWELQNEPRGAESWDCLQDYLAHTENDCEDYLDWFYARLDPDNAIDMHLFLSLIQGNDNYYKNLNVIAYPQEDGTYKYLLAPWDLDLTWGNNFGKGETWLVFSYYTPPEEEFRLRNYPTAKALALDGSFRARLTARWQELRAGDWSDEALLARIGAYEDAVYGSGAMARERERWPTAPSSENAERIRAQCLARLEYLDAYFSEPE